MSVSAYSSYMDTPHVSASRKSTVSHTVGRIAKTVRTCVVFVIVATLMLTYALMSMSGATSQSLPQLDTMTGKSLIASASRLGIGNAFAVDCNTAGTSTDDFKSCFDSATQDIQNSDSSAKSDPISWAGNHIDESTLTDDNSSSNVVAMVLYRVLGAYYLNPDLEQAPDNVDSWKTQECTALDSGHKDIHTGQVVDTPSFANSNCDVPSVTMEMAQNLFKTVIPLGIENGGVQSAKSPWGLGFSQALLPTNEVPVDSAQRQYKYTGLELFGYNLHWTNYNGEFDDISVLSQARISADLNFGSVAKTYAQGVLGGLGQSLSDNASRVLGYLKSGDLIGYASSILNFIPSVIGGTVSTALYRFMANFLNAFEYNATKQGNWYRSDFVASTVYAGQQLTSTQKALVRLVKYLDILSGDANSLTADFSQDEKDSQVPPAPSTTDDWDTWKTAHKDKLAWGETNLGIVASDYDSTAGSAQDKYKSFANAWNDSRDNWLNARKNQQAASQYQQLMSNPETQKKLISAVASADSTISNNDDENMLYCTTKDGKPEGKAEGKYVNLAYKYGLPQLGKEAYKNGKWQCSQQARPTIVGGLFGSARKDKSSENYIDTRRNAIPALNPLTLMFGSNVSRVSGALFGISNTIAMITNTLVGWSFTPILQNLGLKDMTISFMGNVRDSLYLPLIILFIAIGVTLVVFQTVRNGFAGAFKQMALIALVAVLGTVLLINPRFTFTVVDDVPSQAERAVAGVIFENMSRNDVLCSATGSAVGTLGIGAMTGFDGKDSHLNSDTLVRAMQCKVWEAFVFTPYVYGQWGTSYKNLYAQGYAGEGGSGARALTVDKDIQDLVGNAEVKLGGNVTIHNWAVYQLAHTMSGSITTDDPLMASGLLDRNLYRVVDVQAGPYNARGRNATYFDTWRGATGERYMVALSDVAMNIIGLIAIGGLALKKLEYTVAMSLFLFILPLMLLMGVMPSGMLRLKQYGFELLGLIVKRIFTVFFLALGLEVMIEIGGGADSDYMTLFMSTCALCLMMVMYGRELMSKLTATIDTQAGQFANFNDTVRNAVTGSVVGRYVSDTVRDVGVGTASSLIGMSLAGQYGDPNSRRALRRRMRDDVAPNGQRTRRVEMLRRQAQAKWEEFVKAHPESANDQQARARIFASYNKAYAELMRRRDIVMRSSGDSDISGDMSTITSLSQLSDYLGQRYNNMSNARAQEDKILREYRSGSTIGMGQVVRERVDTMLRRSSYSRLRHGQGSVMLETSRTINRDIQRANDFARDTVVSMVQGNFTGIDSQGNPVSSVAQALMSGLDTASTFGQYVLTDDDVMTAVNNMGDVRGLQSALTVGSQTGDYRLARSLVIQALNNEYNQAHHQGVQSSMWLRDGQIENEMAELMKDKAQLKQRLENYDNIPQDLSNSLVSGSDISELSQESQALLRKVATDKVSVDPDKLTWLGTLATVSQAQNGLDRINDLKQQTLASVLPEYRDELERERNTDYIKERDNLMKNRQGQAASRKALLDSQIKQYDEMIKNAPDRAQRLKFKNMRAQALNEKASINEQLSQYRHNHYIVSTTNNNWQKAIHDKIKDWNTRAQLEQGDPRRVSARVAQEHIEQLQEAYNYISVLQAQHDHISQAMNAPQGQTFKDKLDSINQAVRGARFATGDSE